MSHIEQKERTKRRGSFYTGVSLFVDRLIGCLRCLRASTIVDLVTFELRI